MPSSLREHFHLYLYRKKPKNRSITSVDDPLKQYFLGLQSKKDANIFYLYNDHEHGLIKSFIIKLREKWPPVLKN